MLSDSVLLSKKHQNNVLLSEDSLALDKIYKKQQGKTTRHDADP